MASVAAPHRAAERAGAAVMAEGGNAVDACLAMAATLSVVYPHMTGLAGDGFWLIAEPGKEPRGVQACGPAARTLSPDWYRSRGFNAVPTRGAEAALTVPGAVAGWDLARRIAQPWGQALPLARLFEEARRFALQGIAVTRSQASLTRAKASELLSLPGFAETFAPRGLPAEGDLLVQPRWASVFDQLAAEGLDSFYRGGLAETLAADLADLGSPVTAVDLAAYRAAEVTPLALELSVGRVYNLPPPTQGVASLAILGLFDRLGVSQAEGFDHVHGLVEATKQAFAWRNARVGDPAFTAVDPADLLSPQALDRRAGLVDPHRASPWPHPAAGGDTVWFGAVDDQGRVCSVIQSLYWEFGAGVVLPRTGLVWQNRGSSFTLDPGPNQLAGGRLPFHTLNPALARLKDGRTVGYGTMGGEGQPQTQAAFLTRYAWFGQDLRAALDAPRWLLGRTWGEETTLLRLEGRFAPATVNALVQAGHPVEVVGPWDDRMGHAGAVVVHPDGRTEGAHDRRADGGGLTLVPHDPSFLLERTLADLARFGAEADGGVTRTLYDPAWVEGRRWLAGRFQGLGFEVRDDRVGNLYGRLAGTEAVPGVILTGSHLDTVGHGGWYDGAYGVVASALALADLKTRFGPPKRTVEVVAFAEEEGSRFPLAYWGSGHLVGRWPEGTGDTQRDRSGTPLTQAMASAGFGRPDQADPRRADLAAFVEVHIEQGIVLERSGERLGVVEAIVGQRRWLVTVTGEANHAGTTPMGLRSDALAGAAEMVLWLEAEAQLRGDPLVATVGSIQAQPNTPNVVPGRVEFTVDARHTDEAALEAFCADVHRAFGEVAARRGLTLTRESRLTVAPAPLSPRLGDRLATLAAARGLSTRRMPSGAGHDAQVLAGACPTAMLFVPSRRGLSHTPLEHSSSQALADGLAVLTDLLYDLAWKGVEP